MAHRKRPHISNSQSHRHVHPHAHPSISRVSHSHKSKRPQKRFSSSHGQPQSLEPPRRRCARQHKYPQPHMIMSEPSELSRQEPSRSRSYYTPTQPAESDVPPAAEMQRILRAARLEYQEQVDVVVAKWRALVEGAQREMGKYRAWFREERARRRQLETTSSLLRGKLKKYKGRDGENQLIIGDLQRRLNALYDGLTSITTRRTPSLLFVQTPQPRPPSTPKLRIRLSIQHSHSCSRSHSKVLPTRTWTCASSRGT